MALESFLSGTPFHVRTLNQVSKYGTLLRKFELQIVAVEKVSANFFFSAFYEELCQTMLGRP